MFYPELSPVKDFALTTPLLLAEFLGGDSLREELIRLFFQIPPSASVLQSHKLFPTLRGEFFQTDNILIRKCRVVTICRNI